MPEFVNVRLSVAVGMIGATDHEWSDYLHMFARAIRHIHYYQIACCPGRSRLPPPADSIGVMVDVLHACLHRRKSRGKGSPEFGGTLMQITPPQILSCFKISSTILLVLQCVARARTKIPPTQNSAKHAHFKRKILRIPILSAEYSKSVSTVNNQSAGQKSCYRALR